MAAFAIGQIVGLVRLVLVADVFGTRPEMEAFTAASQVPSTLFALVAGGALASAFIPTLTGLLVKEDRLGAWKLASALMNWVLIVLTAAAALAAVFAPQIVRYAIAPGFTADPVKEALTINLMRLLLPSAVIFGLSGLAMGTLNSHQVFWVPALAPSMYQLGMILGVVFLAEPLGIYGLAWGVLLGSALHLGVQVPSLLRLRGHYVPGLALDYAPLREVIRLVGPRLLGVAVVELNFWVNKGLASTMPTGSVTAVEYAFRLMLMPQAAIAQSAATAAMPTLAAQYALGRLDQVRESLAASLRGVLVLSIPAAVGLIVLREPLVAVVYERGEFTAQSTGLVAWALLWYTIGLVSHSVVEVLARAFFALHDTRTPVMVGGTAMTLNVVLSFLFSAMFLGIGWGPHGGLALANSAATSLEALILVYLIARRLGGLPFRDLLSGSAQATLAASLMAAGLWAWLAYSAGMANWLVAGVGLLLGAGLYGAAVLLMGLREARMISGLVVRKLRRLKP